MQELLHEQPSEVIAQSSSAGTQMEVDDNSKVSENEKKNHEDLTVRGLPKSGRWWKVTRKEKTSALVKVKPLKSSWERKMKMKADLLNVKKMQNEIREKIAAEKAAKIEARKEHEKRREENQRKAEIVQIIKNVHKLKRAKKKQLRMIEKRDTNEII